MVLPLRSVTEDAGRLDILARYHVLDTEPEPVFDGLVAIAKGVCEVPVALVSFVDRDRQWFKARIGFEPCETPLDQSVCAHVVAERTVLVIPDLQADARTRDNPLVCGEPFIRFYAGVPLMSPEGEVLGSLCIIDTVPRPAGLTAFQLEALEALAAQVMALLNLRRGIDIRDRVLDNERGRSREIEDRARMQEAASWLLKDEQLRNQFAQEAGRIGTFDVDIASDKVRLSAESCRIFGFPEQDLRPVSDIEKIVVDGDAGHRSSSQTRRNGTAVLDTQYRIRRATDGALRWVARRGQYITADDGNPLRFTGIFEDITERKAAELRQSALLELGDELRGAETISDVVEVSSRILGQTLVAARAGYSIVDMAAGNFNIEGDWAKAGVPSIAGQHALSAFPATTARMAAGTPVVVSDIHTTDWIAPDLPSYASVGAISHINVPVLRNRDLVGLVFVYSDVPRSWSDGELEFARAVADRTYAGVAKVQAEQQQRLLNQELSHRLKNTLAVVQAIATQTLKGAADRPAVTAFRNRLAALSRAHDVLLQQSWASARIKTLAESVLSLQADPSRFAISGPDIELSPKAVLSLSMLLHELATNAAKYGSLSEVGGSVVLEWSIDYTAEQPGVVMVWSEIGGPAISPPAIDGMGSRLIRFGLIGTGEAELNYPSSGFVGKFRAPLSHLSET